MFATIIGNPRSLFHMVLIIAVLVLVTLGTIEGCAVNPTCSWTLANGATADRINPAAAGLANVGCPATVPPLLTTENAKNTCTMTPGTAQTLTNPCVATAVAPVGMTQVTGSFGNLPAVISAPANAASLTCNNNGLLTVMAGGATLTNVKDLVVTCS